MTAVELRRHLETRHEIRLRGHTIEQLTAIHTYEHRVPIDHDHGEAGHLGNFDQLLYLILLAIFIVVFLRLIGVTWR